MSEDEIRILLRVYPGAPRSEVVGFTDGTWRIKVAAPPVKGKANRELISYLSRQLGVSKNALTITGGHTSRNKVIAVAGLNTEAVAQRLRPK